jgi:hypothetical protein
MKLFVGLGNPGREYEGTRHNMGFKTLGKFADLVQGDFDREDFKGVFGIVKNPSFKEPIIICKPQTFMNLSGTCVSPLANYFKIGSMISSSFMMTWRFRKGRFASARAVLRAATKACRASSSRWGATRFAGSGSGLVSPLTTTRSIMSSESRRATISFTLRMRPTMPPRRYGTSSYETLLMRCRSTTAKSVRS